MQDHTLVLNLAKQLLARRSVTPDDAGCQALLCERLTICGFTQESMNFGDTTNSWIRRGTQAPLLVFAGHTDVVPSGPEAQWQNPPFSPTIEGDMLCGRGAADMKGSLAAMVIAIERFVLNHPKHHGSIALLITSDEEGPATHGTVKVMECLQQRQEKIDWCIVGEPSSNEHVGDQIRNGRRGSLNGLLTVRGVQGHVAYPDLACNPIHKVAPVLDAMAKECWDNGNDYFPATSFQVSNIQSGTGVGNVIPGTLTARFNFRFSTAVTVDELKHRTQALCDAHGLEYTIDWTTSGMPFLTEPGALVNATIHAVEQVAGYQPVLSTGGGTSDGRFIAPSGAQVIELGPCNKTIHQINERVSIEGLEKLAMIYEAIMVRLLT